MPVSKKYVSIVPMKVFFNVFIPIAGYLLNKISFRINPTKLDNINHNVDMEEYKEFEIIFKIMKIFFTPTNYLLNLSLLATYICKFSDEM